MAVRSQSEVLARSEQDYREVPDAGGDLPPQVLGLSPREREVATIVYLSGACTAKDVQALLPADLSNGAVRSMLMRLVRKGLLERKWGKRGPNQGHIYLPAITTADLKERALRDIADLYFGGSLLSTAMSALQLLNPDAARDPSHHLQELPRASRVLPFHRRRPSETPYQPTPQEGLAPPFASPSDSSRR